MVRLSQIFANFILRLPGPETHLPFPLSRRKPCSIPVTHEQSSGQDRACRRLGLNRPYFTFNERELQAHPEELGLRGPSHGTSFFVHLRESAALILDHVTALCISWAP